MALLPSANFVTTATGEVYAQFLYFSRPTTIYKAPTETVVNQLSNPLYGYDALSQSNNSQVTLTENYQIFSGLIIPSLQSQGNSNSNFDNKIALENNKTYLKVTLPAHQYINNGLKTEKVVVDSMVYNLEGAAQIGYFLTLPFYYYQIQATN